MVDGSTIQGISDELIPAIMDLEMLNRVVSVDHGDAILMAQKVASYLRQGAGKIVVTVFPDDNKKYLSTDLLGDEPAGEHFLSPDVELKGFRAFKRVCHTCCDPVDCMQTGTPALTDEEAPPLCPRRS